MYWFLAICYFVGIVLALRIVRSPVGAILSAIRDNPLRAAALGHSIDRYKLIAFVIAAAYAGMAGGLLGVLQAFMPPDAFIFETSGQLVMQTVDRRRRHAVRSAARRRGLAVPAATSCSSRSASAPRGSWCWAWSSCCWSCFLRHGLIGGIKDLYDLCAPATRGRRPSRRRRRFPWPMRQPRPLPAAPWRETTGQSGPMLKATGLTKRYGGLARQQRHRLHGQCRRAARHHRPERRGQDDVLQDADLRGPADLGQDRVRRPGHHRQERHRRLPARPDQELPGEPALLAPHGQREPDDRRAGRSPRQLPPRPVPQPGAHSRPHRAGRAHARRWST